jgi:hypothetical protein
MSDLVLPGQYKLLSATLRTNSGATHEFSGFMPTFTIEESIDTDSIRGSAEVYDNVGFLEDLPIRGEEELIIVVEDAVRQRLTYNMKIYKVTDVSINDVNDGLRYVIHFVSKSRFEASFQRITEPHNDEISTIARQIFERYYPEGSTPLISEGTEGIFRCVIPYYTPMQAMNFLANRAYSSTSPSCSFRFFETVHNHYFVSDEFLIRRALDNREDIKQFSFSEALNRSGEEFESQMQNLVEIQNSTRSNTMNDLISGAYTAHAIEIDLVRGTVNLPGIAPIYSYNYMDERDRYFSTSGRGVSQDRHSQEFIDSYFREDNARRYIVVRDYADDSGEFQIRGDQFLPEIVLNRTAYRHHLNNTTLYAKANGRLDLNAGDMIDVRIPQFNSFSNRGLNPQLSGHYLVSDMTHNFIRDIHTTSLKLLKYDWSTQT